MNLLFGIIRIVGFTKQVPDMVLGEVYILFSGIEVNDFALPSRTFIDEHYSNTNGSNDC